MRRTSFALTIAARVQYGVDTFEMQENAITEGQNVVVVDDLIATGGSALAAQQLIEKAKGKVVQNLFVVDVRPPLARRLSRTPTLACARRDDCTAC